MRYFLVLIVFILAISAVNADDSTLVYEFNTPTQSADFSYLTQNLRCLVCANQSLADSNAPLAGDLRQFIYEQIKAGKSRESIKTEVVARYGDYVLYQPPLQRNTWLLWFGPFVILSIAIIIIGLTIRRHSHLKHSSLTPDEKTQLDKLLKEEQRS